MISRRAKSRIKKKARRQAGECIEDGQSDAAAVQPDGETEGQQNEERPSTEVETEVNKESTRINEAIEETPSERAPAAPLAFEKSVSTTVAQETQPPPEPSSLQIATSAASSDLAPVQMESQDRRQALQRIVKYRLHSSRRVGRVHLDDNGPKGPTAVLARLLGEGLYPVNSNDGKLLRAGTCFSDAYNAGGAMVEFKAISMKDSKRKQEETETTAEPPISLEELPHDLARGALGTRERRRLKVKAENGESQYQCVPKKSDEKM